MPCRLGYGQSEIEHRSVAGLAGYTDLAAMGFDDCFGNGKAHACALHLQTLISTAIELFEYQGLFEIVDSRSTVGDAGHNGAVAELRCDLDRRFWGRVLGCVLQQLSYDFCDPAFVHPDQGQVGGEPHIDGMLSQCGFRFLDRSLDGLLDGTRLQLKFELVGVELRHLGSLAHQAIQAVAFFVDHGEQFEALSRVQTWVGE